jgi:hypothetical protein
LDEYGESFKATLLYDPYFVIATKVRGWQDEEIGGGRGHWVADLLWE